MPDRYVVVGARGNRRRERDGAVRGHRHVVAAVLLQHQAAAGKPGDERAHGVGVRRAHDGDVRDVRVDDAAVPGRAADRACLRRVRRLRGDRHGVVDTAGERGWELERAVGRQRQDAAGRFLQHQARAVQAAQGAAHRVHVHAAGDADGVDIGAATGPCPVPGCATQVWAGAAGWPLTSTR